MPTLAEIRQKYPAYADLSDQQIADGLYSRHYSDMPRDQFDAKIGFRPTGPDFAMASGRMSSDRPEMVDAVAAKAANPQDGSMSADNVVRSLGRGTLVGSFLDEANAATNATLAPLIDPLLPDSFQKLPQATWGERYDAAKRIQNQKDAAFDAEHPAASLGLQVAGGVGSAAGALKAAPTAARAALGMGGRTLPQKVVASTTAGAGLGAVSGFGSGEGDIGDRLKSAGNGAMWGAGVGAAVPVVAKGAGEVVGRMLNKAEPPPTTADLRTGANALYDQARQAGLTIKPQAYDRLAYNLVDDLEAAGLDPTLHPRATAALARIVGERGRPIELAKLDQLRQIVRDAASPTDPGEQRLAGIMREKVDAFLDTLKPQDVQSGNARQAVDSLTEARGTWAKMRKSEIVDEMVRRAGESQGGFEKGLRGEITRLLKNKAASRSFTREEQIALRKVSRGGPIELLLRGASKAAPTGVVSSSLSGGAGFVAGGPAGAIAVPAAGLAAKAASGALTARNLRAAQELIRRGAPAPKRGSPLAEAYAHLIAQSGGQSGAAAIEHKPLRIEVTRYDPESYSSRLGM